jgi:3-deoxy-D-manno-octulosonic-acid transferase
MILYFLALISSFFFQLLQKCARFICFFGGAKTRIFFLDREKTQWEKTLADAIKAKSENPSFHNSTLYWVHVASAGELEQIIPILRALHERHSTCFFLTYFSPSAQSFVKNCPGLLAATSLPLEEPQAYAKAITSLKIKRLLLVRYDFWPMLIRTLIKHRCPISILAASVNNTQNSWTSFVSNHLKRFWFHFADSLFLVSDEDKKALISSGLTEEKLFLSGDAKWSRAKERALSATVRPRSTRLVACQSLMEQRRTSVGSSVIVFGSPHSDELHIIRRCLTAQFSAEIILIAPAEVDEKTIASMEKICLDGGALVTRLTQDTPLPTPEALTAHRGPWVLLIDCFGLLAEVYAFADAAIVGGGFDGRLHNVLEPAAHGTVTLYGNQTQRAAEAQQLLRAGGALAFSNPDELFQFLDHWVKLKRDSVQGADFIQKLSNIRDAARNLFGSLPDTSEVVCRVLAQKDNLKTL